MWVTTLTIVMLVAMLAALACIARGTRMLDASLCSLLQEQGDHRRDIERNLARVRRSLSEMERTTT